ncbi:MAG: hypothetical protein IIC35_09610 [Gemmatimonadetes bacterium]|nr:hypothetical protein [Gemmatimonadota bacterium]
MTSRDGHTLVRLEENLTQLASGLFAGTTIGFGVGTGVGIGLPIGLNVLGSMPLAFAAPVGMIGISYVASRAIYRAIVRHRRRAIDELFSRTVAEVEASHRLWERRPAGSCPQPLCRRGADPPAAARCTLATAGRLTAPSDAPTDPAYVTPTS